MTKVVRREVASGQYCTIHCALREDGVTSPASIFLDELAAGMWPHDPDTDPEKLPDDAQISDSAKLAVMFQTLADDGYPVYSTAVNDLNEGVWEFKIAKKRISFFDTPGNGTYSAKYRVDRVHGPDEEYWWFPEFDECVRLGHVFPKHGPTADPDDIDQTLAVREEDVAHDR